MYLIGINDIDEVQQKVTSTAYLRVSWNDTFLQWTPADHGNIDTMYLPQERIWKPDLALSNAFDSISGLGDVFMYLTVDYTGVIVWQPYQVFESTCELDMTYFPFDKQTCDLEMVTWSSTRDMIEIVTGSDGFNIDSYEKNANWDLLGVTTMDTSSSTTSAMTFRMNLKRKPLYYLVNFIFPIVFLSALNVFAFILPCDSGEKTGYAMVLFLSFAIFLLVVTDIMPEGMKTVPVLSTYLLIMCVLSTIYVFIVIIELRFHNLGENVPIPRYMKVFTNFVNGMKGKFSLCKDRGNGSQSDNDSYTKHLDRKIKELEEDEPEERKPRKRLSHRNSYVKDLLYNRKVTPTEIVIVKRQDPVGRSFDVKHLDLVDADDDMGDEESSFSKPEDPTSRQNTKGSNDSSTGTDNSSNGTSKSFTGDSLTDTNKGITRTNKSQAGTDNTSKDTNSTGTNNIVMETKHSLTAANNSSTATKNGATRANNRGTRAKTPSSTFSSKHQSLVQEARPIEEISDVEDPSTDTRETEMAWSNVTTAMDNFFFVFSIILNGLTTAICILVSAAGNAN